MKIVFDFGGTQQTHGWRNACPARHRGRRKNSTFKKAKIRIKTGDCSPNHGGARVVDLYIPLFLGGLGILLYPLPSYPRLARALESLFIVLSVPSPLVLHW